MTAIAHRDRQSRAADALCSAVLALEVLGSLVMWAPIPLAWMWIGARANEATGSLAAGAAVTFLGFLLTTIATMKGLARLDLLWIRERRRAGHDQVEGALTRVVVVSATLGLVGFMAWYYLLSDAFVLPFMPSQ